MKVSVIIEKGDCVRIEGGPLHTVTVMDGGCLETVAGNPHVDQLIINRRGKVGKADAPIVLTANKIVRPFRHKPRTARLAAIGKGRGRKSRC